MTSFRARGVWTALLFAITFLGALPVLIAGIDLTTVTFSSEIPIVVGVGIVLTGYAPTLAALLVAWLVPGSGGLGALLRPILRWRVSVVWYAGVFVVPVLLFLTATSIHVGAGGARPDAWLTLPSAPDLAFLIGALVAGSFGEEVGWRGFALPRLQRRV